MTAPVSPVEAITVRIKHVIRVAWLRSVYWPFWRSINALRRGVIAMRGKVNLVTDDELFLITKDLDEHPDEWEHPCMCATCRSYGDD